MNVKRRDPMKSDVNHYVKDNYHQGLEKQLSVHFELFPLSFTACTLISLSATLFGIYENGDNKYTRLIPQEGCFSSWKVTGTYETMNVDGILCCDEQEMSKTGTICSNDSHLAHMMSTILGSWILPLSPLFIAWHHVGFSKSILNSNSWNHNPFLRLKSYLTLMLVRTFLLYYILNYFEQVVQTTVEHPCSYEHLLPHGKCDHRWNASDHVLLFITHHIAVVGSELGVQLSAFRRSDIHVLPILSCFLSLCICLVASYCMHQTARFFHVPSESICALGLGLITIVSWRRFLEWLTSS